jgi:DNA replication protein DnaC
MEEWTFENADMSDAVMHKAKSYVDNWEEMKRNHIGCLFWGPVGTGKSYIAVCIANELLKREVTVKMTNFNTIIDDIFPLADKTEYINALASYQLLIIDDLGVERNSEYALGIIFSVIDRRIRSGRPLIITTNLPLKEIKSETMLDKRRIYDRILEMCTPMYVGGASKREAIASMKMEKAKTLLNTNRGEEECE